jgi:hypothetical protein
LWKRIQEAESIDIAFGVIDEFIHEWEEWIDQGMCDELKDALLWKGLRIDLKMWMRMSTEEKQEYIPWSIFEDRKECASTFAEIVKYHSWNRHPNNPHDFLHRTILPKIRALYTVDKDLVRSVWRGLPKQFRNTKYTR